jgi:uncharacterized protein YjeT (DUF2065 family)
MIFTKIILIIFSSALFVCGVLITIFPEAIKKLLKKCSALPINLFCLIGYFLGFIGLFTLVIIFLE